MKYIVICKLNDQAGALGLCRDDDSGRRAYVTDPLTMKKGDTVFAVTSHDNEIAPEDEQKWIDAKRKFGEYYNRVVETKNFTARGEELTAIQQTIDASLDLVKHEFEVQPKFSFWTFNWMKSYLAGARTDESTRVTLNLDKAGIMKRIRAHKLNNRYLFN